MVLPEYPLPKTEKLPPIARHRWVWNNLTAVRINPLGLVNRFQTGYRLQLFDSENIVFRKTFAAIKLATEISPSNGCIGGSIQLQPLALLKLTATQYFVGAFGTFSTVQSYPSLLVDYSDTALDEAEERNENYPTIGEKTELSALVQAKVGPVAIRNQLTGMRWRMDLNDDHTVMYNIILDVLQPNGGWVLANDTDLIYLFDGGFKLGLRYTATHVFHGDHIHGADDESLHQTNHRLGPALVYTFFDEEQGAGWNNVTVALLTQWWLKHPYRTGLDSSAGLPHMLLVLSQRGDFMP